MSNNQKEKLTSTKKLVLLVTIVRKYKVDYYLDILNDFSANMQMVLIGNGTTKSAIFSDEVGTKAIIISVLVDDQVKPALKLLNEKFAMVRDGKGVAWAVPLSSVMGVTLFNFLSNNKGSII